MPWKIVKLLPFHYHAALWIVTRPGSIVAIVLDWQRSKPKQNLGAGWFAARLQSKKGANRQRLVAEPDFLTCVESFLKRRCSFVWLIVDTRQPRRYTTKRLMKLSAGHPQSSETQRPRKPQLHQTLRKLTIGTLNVWKT